MQNRYILGRISTFGSMFNMDWVRLDLKNGELDGTKIATQDYLNENWNEVESCATQILEHIGMQ